MNCRHCKAPLEHPFVDLGFAPPSNAYRSAAQQREPELHFPLRTWVCASCWLVQTEDYARADELFSPDYAYFSSISQSWVEHARRYAEAMTRRLHLNADSFVMEIASNDGYLLQHFVRDGVPCLGIEPTASTAAAAERIGVPTLQAFFGAATASELKARGVLADLIVANNVFAHVPDINDFATGLKTALKGGGTVTLEFPHLLNLIRQIQFDTIYHEHFSYLSLYAVQRILAAAGLRVFDVETLGTHGGSLRIFACHADDARQEQAAVATVLAAEREAGLYRLDTYAGFQARVDQVKDGLWTFLIAQKRAGRKVVGYGAAAKGNTLLNYAGIKRDLLPFVCDAAPSKQGKFLPGSGIPVRDPEWLRKARPDTVLILPWNIADEVMSQHRYIEEWGGQFAVAVPQARMLDHAAA